jgi:two-component system, response regulator PdtaR
VEVQLAPWPGTRLFQQWGLHASPDRGCADAGQRPRILIVEDDYLVALELEHRLLEGGFDVVGVAASADEATTIARSQRPDLAVMDIRLGKGRDGIDAAVELRKELSIRSVFATAHCDDDTIRRAREALPMGWLTKPYSYQALIATINGALREQA